MKLTTLLLSLVTVLLAMVIGCHSAMKPEAPSTSANESVVGAEALQPVPPPSGPFYGPKAKFYGMAGGSRVRGTGAARSADGTRPSGEEELWIIQRPGKQPAPPPKDDNTPGSGVLVAKREAENVVLPLKHTDVKAAIAGYIATTDVTQTFHNPYPEKIEAIYVFPLPHNAAVNEFVMTLGERKIRGIIREREEATKLYNQAKSAGHVASLLTQERPNVFTQAVANIEPGKQIDINIRYFNTLAYDAGWYEYVFPMVVGPRFNPPGSTSGVGAKPADAPAGATGQKTEISYLKPGQTAMSNIDLTVQIHAGVPVEKIEYLNHEATVREHGSGAEVTLTRALANKDFVLRYKVAGGTIKSAIMTQRKGEESFFTLMLYPPESLKQLRRQPLELVFTLDVSGSMSGAPIEQSKAAIRYALQHMDERDTFQIIRFAGGATRLDEKPVPVTPENLRRAMAFIESTEAGGGTMMVEGIRASLDFPRDEGRLRFVTFLTDGYIGNETEILREVQKSLGPSRIFSFGVGSSPNRYLLDAMAKMGNGAVAYLSLNEKAEDVMSLFFDRISHPAMTDVTIDFGQMNVSDALPGRAPDLFVGRPVVVTGKFAGRGRTTVNVTGTVAGQRQTIAIPVDLDAAGDQHAGIASVWARQKIAELSDRAIWDTSTDYLAAIRQTALHYGLMSPFTAFLAVDTATRTAGDHGTSVAVPVPMPQGVKYETTVPE